jgi:sterol desaturase/sphingolipid hydroxylase (fatty acid hydroxylase superfamily)
MIKHAIDLNYLVGSTIDTLATTLTTWVMEARLEDWMALCFLAALLTCVHIEFRWPFLRPGLRAMKQSYLTNVCTYLFNDITLSVLSVPSLYLIAQQFSGHGLLSPIPQGPLQWLLTFLLLDLTLYAWHYATHHFDGLWLFHKVHHSDRSFNVTTGLRFHMGELFLEVLIRVAFIAVTGVSAEVVLINQAIISLFVLFHHTNCSFPAEALLSRLMIVPRLHRRHHSVLRAEHDSNYGAVLSVWDRIFGTLSEGEPHEIGLVGVEEQRFIDLVRDGFGLRKLGKPGPALVPQSEEAS